MVADPENVWIGMEFFCNETDDFWKMPDEQIKALAITELEKIGLIAKEDVLDSNLVRVEKTYPAYFGAYERFEEVKVFTDKLQNLFLVGRNGMHKYNNSDHSMLTAMVAVDNICEGIISKIICGPLILSRSIMRRKKAQSPIPRNQPMIRTSNNRRHYVRNWNQQ